MSISYYPQWYKCEASNGESFYCGQEQQHYVWSNEVESSTHQCTCCGAQLSAASLYEKPEVPWTPMLKTPTANKVRQASRKQRNLNHFKKEVYPTLKRGSLEQKHHAKKHKLK